MKDVDVTLYLNEHRVKALADALTHRTVNIDMTLYAVMDDAMHSYQESEDENALSEKEMDEEMSEAPSMQM